MWRKWMRGWMGMRVSAHRQTTPAGLGRAAQFRSEMSEEEVILWSHLRGFRKHGWAFRRQAQLGRYTADFLCRKAMLVVEVDGWHHDLPERMESDCVRDEWMKSEDYRILRIPAGDVRRDIEGVLDAIEDALRATSL